MPDVLVTLGLALFVLWAIAMVWLPPYLEAIGERRRQKELAQQAKELAQQAKSLTEKLEALVKEGAVEDAITKYHDASSFECEVARLLPESLHKSLQEEWARRLLNPDLWALLTRNSSQVAALDPPSCGWYAFSRHISDPGIILRWQAFVYTCCLLIPDLTKEAREWIAMADEYQMGRLSLEEFKAASNLAWDFYEANEAIKSPSDLSGLTVARHCLLIPGQYGWDELTCRIIEDLEAAGVPESRWYPLLWTFYPEIRNKSR